MSFRSFLRTLYTPLGYFLPWRWIPFYKGVLRSIWNRHFRSSSLQQQHLRDELSQSISPFALVDTVEEPSIIQESYYLINHRFRIIDHLKSFAGYSSPVKSICEHGLYLEDKVIASEAFYNNFNTLITLGEFRAEIIQKHTKGSRAALPVGPYIHYVQDFYSDQEIASIKAKNGKTLVVFPSHSPDQHTSLYDFSTFIDEIEEVKRRYSFETVIICMYWRDILLDLHTPYAKAGYTLACCGHFYDFSFLPRLKSILRIADVSMSNDVGTHIGFSIYLGTPHYLFRQSIKFAIDSSASGVDSSRLQEDSSQYFEEYEAPFMEYSEVISEEQKETVRYYFGTDCIKSSSELKDMFLSIEQSTSLFRLPAKRERKYQA